MDQAHAGNLSSASSGEAHSTQGEHYVLNAPILGIYSNPNHHKLPLTLPQNAVVRVLEGDISGDRIVDVLWEGKVVMMFTIDLRNRCEKVQDRR